MTIECGVFVWQIKRANSQTSDGQAKQSQFMTNKHQIENQLIKQRYSGNLDLPLQTTPLQTEGISVGIVTGTRKCQTPGEEKQA